MKTTSQDNEPALPLGQQLRELWGSRVFVLANSMEILERLAYYGLRTVLPIYMVLAIEEGGPQFSHTQKGSVYAWWALIQSLVPMFTGGLADRYGYKLTVGISIAFKTAGYLVMSACVELGAFFSGGASTGQAGHPAVLGVFMAGALLLAFGTAIFKPGLQGMIAVSIPKGTNSVAWAVFYQLVNVGGWLGPYLAGVMRLMSWRYVFLSCAAIVCLNYFVLMTFKEPSRGGDGFGRSNLGSVMWQSIIGILQPRLACFIVLFSGYWFMYFQLFDILPNFIADWVDSSAILKTVVAPIIETFGGTVPEQWNGQVPQEHLININAFVCMTLAFLAGYLTAGFSAVTAMVIGIAVSCVGIYMLGLSQVGLFTLLAIVIFSLGEITASPKKMQYLASLAPPGREALYLGYVNVTQALGWSIGSLVAGKIYEASGDKVVLARKMLVDKYNMDPTAVEELNKTAVLPKLQEMLGQGASETTHLLWTTYEPYTMWGIFAIVGASSMVGLMLYQRLAKKIGDSKEWIFAVISVVYTFLVYDRASFTSVPVFALGVALLIGLYMLIRKFWPRFLPEGARAE